MPLASQRLSSNHVWITLGIKQNARCQRASGVFRCSITQTLAPREAIQGLARLALRYSHLRLNFWLHEIGALHFFIGVLEQFANHDTDHE